MSGAIYDYCINKKTDNHFGASALCLHQMRKTTKQNGSWFTEGPQLEAMMGAHLPGEGVENTFDVMAGKREQGYRVNGLVT